MTPWIVVVGCAFMAPQDEAVRKLIRSADGLYAQRDRDGMAAKAVETLKKALALDESCVEAYWKLARACYWLGTREKESAKAAPIFREAIDYLKIAVFIDGDSIEAHYWLGVSYGMFGQAKGILQSLDLVEPMKKEIEWVIARDEKFQDGGGHRVLGRLYFKLPGFKGGDNEEAKRHLKRAIELAPKNLMNYLFLAEVYYSESRRKEAKETLLKLLEQPDDPEWAPECREQREDAKRLLAAVEKE